MSGASEKEKGGVPLYALILGAMILGLLLGPRLGKSGFILGEIGRIVITLIKGVATPLLFLSIVNSILTTEVKGRDALRMFFFAMVNVTIALGIGLLLSNVLRPGEHLALPALTGDASAYQGKKVDFLKTLVSYVPSNFVTPFAENIVISVIIVALMLGFGLRRVRTEQIAAGSTGYQAVEALIATLLRVTEIVLGWVIKLIPFAVFAVSAKTVGEHGYAPLKGLGVYVGVGLFGLALHVVVTYQAWLVFYARMSLRRFWKGAREPLVVALGTNSSLATLPVTLQALDRLGVSRSASTLGACVGTNLNNDGIVLYEGMAVLFVAQAMGFHLSLGEQMFAAITCIVAAMGVAGVPEAGFISLALVLGTVGLPVELLPLILSVDWIIARARSLINVLSDMLLSILIDRSGGATAYRG
jgi:DAACS family dicarboxylate/amino acid:cation (Na+ or H+) symporter